MFNFIIILISLALTLANYLLHKYTHSALVILCLFLINASLLLFGSIFVGKRKVFHDDISSDKTNKKSYVLITDHELINQRSVSIFIRIFIYFLPIMALIGLYIINLFGVLKLESANSWISFILSIAAFVMSIITIWQSEGTYARIFNALDEIREKTNSSKSDLDLIKSSVGILTAASQPHFKLNYDLYKDFQGDSEKPDLHSRNTTPEQPRDNEQPRANGDIKNAYKKCPT